jgi:tetratricopeptide (TPR) repeat protein
MRVHAIQFETRRAASVLLALLVVPVLLALEAPNDYLLENYESALNSGLYDEAAIAAKARLDQAIREGQVKELSTAGLLHELAEVQRLTGEYNSALQNYELAIEIIESKRDMLDLALTEPLLGLGKTYIEAGRPDLALDHLDRALHVRSVNEGPHSIENAATLEALADAYLRMGEFGDAANTAHRLYLLYSHEFPDMSKELVPILIKIGQILGEIGIRREERNMYAEAIGIVERNEGKKSPGLIRPLISLGNSHQHEYFDSYFDALSDRELPDTRLLDKAESFYESAVELVRSNDDVDWRVRNEAILALGDFYTVTGEQARARVYYRDAWNFLTADPERLPQRIIDLEGVVPLQQPLPDMTVALPRGDNSSSTKLDTGHITTQFTVTRRGGVEEIGLVEISPERNAEIEAEVKRSLTRYLYRPRIANGSAVSTPGQTLRYEFPYPRIPVAKE